MTFDVTKFLALTAVLAGASIGAAACSSNSNDDNGDNGGSSGSAGSSSGSNAGGDNNNGAGSSAYAGQSNGLGGEGGALGGSGGAAGGANTAGADTGGAATAGAGSGGEGGAEACLADAAFEGDPCADILDTKCDGAEEGFYNPFYDLCWASGGSNMTVRLAFAACLEGDECAETAAASAQACWSAAASNACPKEGAAAACTTMLGTCTDGGLTQADCVKMVNNYTYELDFVPECLDPNAEGFDDFFVGDCKERLAKCIGVPAF